MESSVGRLLEDKQTARRMLALKEPLFQTRKDFFRRKLKLHGAFIEEL